jgi:hypothetical protein
VLSCFEVQKLRGISYNSQRLLDAVFYSSQKDQCRLFARVNWEFHVDEVVLVGWHWRDEDMWNSSTLILQWIPIHTWPEYDLSSQSFCLLNSLVWLVEFLEGVRSQCWWNEDVVGLVDKPTFGCQFLAVWVVRLYFNWNQYLMIWPPILYLLDQKFVWSLYGFHLWWHGVSSQWRKTWMTSDGWIAPKLCLLQIALVLSQEEMHATAHDSSTSVAPLYWHFK